jgi:hypothetical protein
MQWSIVPIRNEAWEIYQYLAVQKDVTHLVHTEQKLQAAMEEERRRLLEIEKTNRKLNKLIARQKKTLELFIKYVPEPIVVQRHFLKKRTIFVKGNSWKWPCFFVIYGVLPLWLSSSALKMLCIFLTSIIQ